MSLKASPRATDRVSGRGLPVKVLLRPGAISTRYNTRRKIQAASGALRGMREAIRQGERPTTPVLFRCLPDGRTSDRAASNGPHDP